MGKHHAAKHGFTLLELSVVLVVIALIIGGIVLGKTLVRATAIRSQIKQIESFRTAVSAFKLKYNVLPGDLTARQAVQFNFQTRTGATGRGDGNGLIVGNAATSYPYGSTGEIALFWNDLGRSGIIPYNFSGVDCPSNGCQANNITTVAPLAVLGKSNAVSPYSDTGRNYFRILSAASVGSYGDFQPIIGGVFQAISPLEAYGIDVKLDDGAPLTGNVSMLKAGTALLTAPTDDTPATPATFVCISNVNNLYNLAAATGGDSIACIPRISME